MGEVGGVEAASVLVLLSGASRAVGFEPLR